MLKESLYGCFLFGTNDYNGVLWTLQILFLGAYIDYALAALTGGRRFRWIVYAIVAVVFCLFTIGADLMMVLEFMGVIG